MNRVNGFVWTCDYGNDDCFINYSLYEFGLMTLSRWKGKTNIKRDWQCDNQIVVSMFNLHCMGIEKLRTLQLDKSIFIFQIHHVFNGMRFAIVHFSTSNRFEGVLIHKLRNGRIARSLIWIGGMPKRTPSWDQPYRIMDCGKGRYCRLLCSREG